MTSGGSNVGPIPIRDALTLVFKRRIWILAFSAVVLLLVTPLALLWPPTYEAVASLLVNRARAEIPIAAKESTQLIISQVSPQEINSEIEILRSRTVLAEVLRVLEVDESWRPTSRFSRFVRAVKRVLGAPRLSYFEEMLMALEDGLHISDVRKSNVIRIRYRSRDPEWAARVVSTLTEKYLERRARIYQSPQAVSFFADQMRDAQELLETSEQELKKFLLKAGMTVLQEAPGSDSLAKQKALLLERLDQLENQLRDAQAAVEEGELKAHALRSRLAKEPQRLKTADRMNHPAAVEEVEMALAAYRLKRDELLQDFRSDSRDVRDIDAQIRAAEQQLEQARREDVAGINGTEMNPVYQDIKTEFSRVEATLAGARGRLTALRDHIAQYRRELDDLNNNAFELERLNREAEAAEEAYLLYRKKHEELRIAAAMDQQKLVNVTVAQPAELPLEPVAPRRKLLILVGGLLGLAGGFGSAWAIENYFDRTFTTGAEVERRLRMSNLASIPEGG